MSESNSFVKGSWERFRQTSFYKMARFITNSASVALLITAALFLYQEYEERDRADKIINNLQDISKDMVKVQSGISTRYLGIFPNYIEEANHLLKGCKDRDSIIIFEDVLYYGFLSRPEAFVEMNKLLLSHADGGGTVTIVYYDEDGRTFHRMIREEFISPSLYATMERDRRTSSVSQDNGVSLKIRMAEDSLRCKKYFSITQKSDTSSFRKTIERYQASLVSVCDSSLSPDVIETCRQIDSVKNYWLGGKTPSKVDFFDIEDMYRAISKIMVTLYHAHGIELLPLDEYLTMCCWLAGDCAVLAFPSKWASDEIGFFSQDPAFTRYITAMLAGARGSVYED